MAADITVKDLEQDQHFHVRVKQKCGTFVNLLNPHILMHTRRS
jgi:hypothetical protein